MLKPCFKLKMKSFLFINLIKNSSFPYLKLFHFFPPSAAVMSRPFEFRERGIAWEIYRDQIIFLTRLPLFCTAKADEI